MAATRDYCGTANPPQPLRGTLIFDNQIFDVAHPTTPGATIFNLTTEYTEWIRTGLAAKNAKSAKAVEPFQKNFADVANFARAKTIRTLFYMFLHVLHG